MSMAYKLSSMLDKSGMSSQDVADATKLGIATIWNMRSRGIGSIKDLLSVCNACGYRMYLYNKEINMKIEVTQDDFK